MVLEIADDASSAVGYDTLVFQKKVDAVIAMETSAARSAALPIINRGKIPYIYSSFYEGRSCNRWMHVNGWVPEQQVAPIVDHFMKKRGVKTFFLVGSDYSLAGACSSSPASTSRSRVARWWARNTCPWTAPTGRPSSPRSARPCPARWISSTAGGSPNVGLAKQIRAAGLSMPYGNLAIDEGTARTMGDTAAGMYMSASYLTSIDNAQNHKFLAALKAKFGDQAKTANDLSEPQYEGFYLYKAAVEKPAAWMRRRSWRR